MIKGGLSAFRNKRVLLLQGPLGPFFRRLARDLEGVGAHVFKVNFNGGDWLFYPDDAISFRGKSEEWPAFFESLLIHWQIDVVMLFGDCRPMHAIAHQIAQLRSIEVGVFEEGYIRPDYITLERFGVNGHSLLPRLPDYYRSVPLSEQQAATPVGKPFWYTALWAMLYYLASVLMRPRFPHYRHHRPLTLLEAWPWLRGFWRKGYYAFKERGIQAKLVTDLAGKYFLMPLQVHNDAQIHTHSEFASVKGFIRSSIHSFARHAPADTLLVIKHHPLDRGYHDYTRFIAMVARSNRVADRVLYVHDLHLPTLLQHARGAVLVNSTVGLSALHHGTPTKVCGSAIYDMGGLAYQGLLKDFWTHATPDMVDKELFACFQNYLIEFTQLNGNFYKRLRIPGSHAGLRWGDRSKASLEAKVASCDLVAALEKTAHQEGEAAA